MPLLTEARDLFPTGSTQIAPLTGLGKHPPMPLLTPNQMCMTCSSFSSAAIKQLRTHRFGNVRMGSGFAGTFRFFTRAAFESHPKKAP
jgi:hypothetical protein